VDGCGGRFVFSSDVKISIFFGGGENLMMDEVRVGKSRRNKNVIISPSYASILWFEYRKTKNMTKNHSLVRQKSTIRSCHLSCWILFTIAFDLFLFILGSVFCATEILKCNQ
jgi:hypothetical protein